MRKWRVIVAIVILCAATGRGNAMCSNSCEEEPRAAVQVDSITTAVESDSIAPAGGNEAVKGEKKRGFWGKFFKQLFRGDKDRSFEKGIDFTYTLYPMYSRETGVGIGGVVTALYRIDRRDSITPPSDAQLLAGVSLKGAYKVSIAGNNYFNNKSRLVYDVYFVNKPIDFWGISYASCVTNSAASYTRRQIEADVEYLYNINKRVLIGAVLNVGYSYLPRINNLSYLDGEATSYLLTGVGVSLSYDSRDFIPNAQEGVFLQIREMIYPQFMGNAHKSIFTTTLRANYYRPLWRGSVIALDLYSYYSGSNSPWPLRVEMGGDNARMRGYYVGRYIDNNQLNFQVELRQRVYKRIGVVGWIGYGTVYPSLEGLRLRNFLYNYGVGFRWEIKHRINLRVDIGFGYKSFGVVVNLREAF